MFPTIFKELRLSKNLTQNDISKILNVVKSTVGMWEQGRRMPDDKMLIKISKYFNVSLDKLLGLENFLLPLNAFPVPPLANIPVYGRVSAGVGCLAIDEVIGYELFDAKYNDGKHFCLQVSGDSMEPRISEGDFVLIKKQTSVDSGSIAVVLVDDEDGVIKKVIYDTNLIELHSFNPYYPTRRFIDSDVLRLRVVGRVIEMKRKF